MNKPFPNPASVGLRGYQLEDVERLEDAFKTHLPSRRDARNSRKRHYGAPRQSAFLCQLFPKSHELPRKGNKNHEPHIDLFAGRGLCASRVTGFIARYADC